VSNKSSLRAPFRFLSGRFLSRDVRTLSANIRCLFFLALALPSCGNQADQNDNNQTSEVKIVNGVAVLPGTQASKHTVALTMRGDSFCTGTYIAAEWVLTAAHCVLDHARAKAAVQVEFGRGVLPALEQDRSIGIPLLHPDYRGDQSNDIALIRLMEPVTKEAFQPVTLAKQEAIEVGELVQLAGYGTIGLNKVNKSGKLLETQVEISKVDESTKLIHYASRDGVNSACHGDSGGPMYLTKNGDLELAGVTHGADLSEDTISLSTRCLKYGIYTNAPAFLPWISETVQKVDELLAQAEKDAAKGQN
jgi:secreted trypsin-like serine protease